ncbi:hypothetical protein BCF59_0234 [Mycoplasmopsis mustelae]|uniref:PDxFFG protein n=1 Tax=Mycoplasmopsis mustelae TaxID=171289 RepID=A0A4R7UCZ2_9BACT|nr:PDxFFG protein [Mycoplasmopsis mustelae]TDV24279.1 hypothetical protein BCF59_0234 [Mycoplasmopsis mustelae]
MKKIKLSLKAKVLLSAGIIASASGVAVASMYAYANNSDEVKGSYLAITEKKLKNDYSQIYDANRHLKPEISILDPLKKYQVGFISDDYENFGFIEDKKKLYSFDEFFAKYFERFKESFILEVKFGSFSFFDEYVLAVKPSKFIEFSKWFINTVAWGPDLLTLESFRLVPGVEQSGNSITLGSHSTVHKEVSEIKFFPDAFFGSMPIYSILSGAGNGRDALTYSLFKEQQDKKTIDEFLASIPTASAIYNAISRAPRTYNSFLSLALPYKLINKKFKILPDTKNKFNENTLVFADNITQKQFNDIKTQLNLADNVTFDSLIETTVTSAIASDTTTTVAGNSNKLTEPLLIVTFDYKPEGSQDSFSFIMREGNVSPQWDITYHTFKKAVDADIAHFLDFYDVKAYENKEIWAYIDSNDKISLFKSKLEAINNIPELKNWETATAEVKSRLGAYLVKSIDVKDAVFTTTLENVENKNSFSLSFAATTITSQEKDLLDEFKHAVGYQGAISPITLQAGPEDISILDENGKPKRGLSTRKYDVFNEAYTGLIDKVLAKYPHLAKKLTGPHVAKKLNAKGYYEYSLEDGDYIGFSEDDRIGLPLVLGATLKDFDGISTEFLRYVATHEYGHHYTLDESQALNQDSNAVVVGGISPRNGISESSYYSAEALRNYLKARTTLDFVRVNALGEQTDSTNTNGQYIKFLFKNKDTGQYVRETEDQIWGNASQNAHIESVLSNKQRRFLQDFDGLKEAANQRKTRLGNLFIANSFDENSGTINPFISGTAKTFEPVINGDTTSYVFKDLDIKRVIKEIKDGTGQSIENAIEITDSNNLTINVVDLVTETIDGQTVTKATKINVFNRDGSPAINVPLNEPLDKASQDYIKAQTNIIKESIINLVRANFIDSGWNSNTTDFGGSIGFSLTNYSDRTDLKGLAANLKDRANPIEYDPATNNIDSVFNPNVKDKRKSWEYAGFTAGDSVSNVLSDMFAVTIGIEDARSKGTRSNPKKAHIEGALYSQIQDVLVFVDAKDKTKIKSSYTFPLIEGNKFLSNQVWDKNDVMTDQLHRTFQRYNIPATGIYQNNPIFRFLLSGLKLFIRNNNNTPYFHYLGADNSVSNSAEITQAYWRAGRDPKARNTLHNLTQKISFNNFDNFSEGNDSLYAAFNLKIKAEVHDGEKTATTAVFETFEDMIDFSSIDYSKATYIKMQPTETGTTAIFNWDINYVKTKFDFNAFKEAVATSQENEQQKQFIANADDQTLANEIMRRFRHSNYFLTVKDFNPATELEANKAILSDTYGITYLNPEFKNIFSFEAKPAADGDRKYTATDYQKTFRDYVVSTLGEEGNNEKLVNSVVATLNSQDLYRVSGNVLTFWNRGQTSLNRPLEWIYAKFRNGQPSSDVLNYNQTRVEPQLQDKFTDYVYNISETLTRDFVQTTYLPSTVDFENLPGYMTSVNESYTGLDYVVDATKLNVWNDRKNDPIAIYKGVYNAVKAAKFDNYYQQIKEVSLLTYQAELPIKDEIAKANLELDKVKKEIESQQNELKKATTQEQKDAINAKIQELNSISESFTNSVDKNNKLLNELILNKNKVVLPIKDVAYNDTYKKPNSVFENTESRTSSYFGKFITQSNGYFKDRFEKSTIGMELYDDLGNEVIDNEISLKDFESKPITSRPRAFFISQLLNFGVSKRTVTGIFRNKRLDALALYGFVKNADAQKIKKIRFTDTLTGEQKFLTVNFKDTNNIFYLKKQGDINSKVRIEDEGYTSWISDYGIMAKYRNTLLDPKHKYYAQFVDENNNAVSDLNIGDFEYLSENGKTGEQASVKIKTNKDPKTQDKGKTIIYIDYQFNITG